MRAPLDGQACLVTGGSGLVGGEVAVALAGLGAEVGLHYHRSRAAAEAVARRIRAMGREVALLQADLKDPAAIAGMGAQVRARFGPVTILVNSAASMVQTPIRGAGAQAWAEVMDLNLRAPFLCTRALLPGMEEAGHGVVVNLLDLSPHQAWVGYGAHAASKAGLEALTRVMARELAPTVRVNGLALGIVEGRRAPAKALSKVPLGGPVPMEDAISAMVELVTNQSITGAVLTVDRGRLAGPRAG